MKINLPKESKTHQDIIDQISDIIKQTGKNKIAYVILFGSFAKGDWIDDFRREKDGTLTSYNSDYDFLILTKKHQDGQGRKGRDLERKITEKIYNSCDDLLRVSKYPFRQSRAVTIIVESLNSVNNELKKGHYFFSDIKKEGVLFYKADDAKELSDPKELSREEAKEISQDYFDYWFKSAEEFFEHYKFSFKKDYNNKAAFMLHQTTESLFNCTELVFTHYKPKTHDIEELNRRCVPFNKRFKDIFPKNLSEEKECFELLKLAYIDARYDKNYSINKEQLEYLITKIEKLKEIVKEVCLQKINSF